MDQIQGALQAHVLNSIERGSPGEVSILEPSIASEVLDICADSGYATLGIGSARVAVPFGSRLVAKLQWNPSPWHPPYGEQDINLCEAAVWMAADDDRATVLNTALALSRSGVLWMTRAAPIAPSFDPGHPMPANYFDVLDSVDAYGQRIADLLRKLGGDSWADELLERAGPRPNNFGLEDGRLVLFDYPHVPMVEFDSVKAWIVAELDQGDLVLARGRHARKAA